MSTASYNYKSSQVDRIFFTRWTGDLTKADLLAVMRDLDAAVARANGQQVIAVFVTPQGVPPPSSEIRGELVRMNPELLKRCESVHNVLEGSGFWASAMRAMLVGLGLAIRARGKMHVHDSVEHALAAVCPPLRMDRAVVLRRVRVDGIVA